MVNKRTFQALRLRPAVLQALTIMLAAYWSPLRGQSAGISGAAAGAPAAGKTEAGAKRSINAGRQVADAASSDGGAAQASPPAAGNSKSRRGQKHPTVAQAWTPNLAGNSAPFWVSAQWNVIAQGHGRFRSPYQGPNSLLPGAEEATSSVETLYTGWDWHNRVDLLLDLESAGGKGISNALGLAAFTNLDVVRNPSLGPSPYVARALVHAVVPLDSASASNERNPLDLFSRVPRRRIELYAGKFSVPDFLDQNSVLSDSHTQFLNWAIDNSAAYDYAADTRGYTQGIEVEYDSPALSLKFLEALMPVVANGLALDHNLRQNHATNLELDWTYSRKHNGVLRLLGYDNKAAMGSYATAIAQYRQGLVAAPDVTLSRVAGRGKPGGDLNWEQEILPGVTAAARAGWERDSVESFAYTEAGNSYLGGVKFSAKRWGRRLDKASLAFVSSGISTLHRQYLALGGLGFLLGDGHLNYGRETVLESYYTFFFNHNFSLAPDLQWIHNPGYNRDRGPALVAALRLHLEL